MFSRVLVLVLASLCSHSLAGHNLTRNTISYIINGQRADIAEFPFMVAISQRVSQLIFICGGSLISAEWVVTAGHCVDSKLSPSQYQLRLGSSRLGKGGVLRRGLRAVIHEGFDSGEEFLGNDIALIKIGRVKFSNAIRPVWLPRQNQEVAEDTRALIAGFGKQRNGNDAPASRFLMKAVVPYIDTEKCRTLMWNLWELLLNTTAQICFGDLNGGSSTCIGDSGGPLVVDGVLVGLTSWGIRNRCGQPHSPGVFVRVSNYRDWITSNSGV